jgi:hypothetical protein
MLMVASIYCFSFLFNGRYAAVPRPTTVYNRRVVGAGLRSLAP